MHKAREKENKRNSFVSNFFELICFSQKYKVNPKKGSATIVGNLPTIPQFLNNTGEETTRMVVKKAEILDLVSE